MRIAILAHNLRGGGGISVGRNIIASLGRIAADNNYLTTIPPHLGYEEITAVIPHCKTVVFPDGGSIFRRWLFDNHELPKIVKSWKPDVVLGLGNMGLYGNKIIPQAVLCHNPFLLYDRRHYGRTYGLKNLLIQKILKRPRFAADLRNSQIVFCQTRTAEKRIREVYGYRGECRILPNAVSFFTQSGEHDDSVPDALRPHMDKFRLFYLTKYYSHKNIEILVDMFDRCGGELSSVVLFLTVAAEQGRGAARLLHEIERRGLQERIINVGPIPQESLGSYFHNVNALLMPTLLESFSGSYLEAMHFGVPILTSDLDFAREVCGNAAVYFDPWKMESIKEAILKLINNPKMAELLISKGREQMKRNYSTWNSITEKLLENLHEIVAN